MEKSTSQPTQKASFAALLVLVTVIAVADGYDLTVLSAALPVILAKHEWGLTAATAGVVASIQMLGLLIGAILSGSLRDRIGGRKMLILNLLFFSIFTAIVPLAPNAAVLGAFRFLGGLGLGGIIPVMIVLVSEFSPPGRRHLNNTVLLMGTAVGGLLAPLSGALILPHANFRWLFVVGGLFPLIVLVPLVGKFVPESPTYLLTRRADEARTIADRYGIELDETVAPMASDGERTRSNALRYLFNRSRVARTVLLLIAEFFIMGVALGLTSTWLPQYLVLGGFEITSALLVSVTTFAGAIVGGLVGGWLQDRTNPKLIVVIGCFGGAATLLLIGAALQVAALVYVLVFALGFLNTIYIMNGFIANSHPAAVRATMVGLAFGVGRTGGIFLTAAGGWVAAAALPPAANFWLWSVALFIPAVVLLFARSTSSVPAAGAVANAPAVASTVG
ncbi:hypothetical protein DLE60_07365 [Micromonospora globispora]|nr:hypothetical protein DLE60_07365 [Micromonospora globispora]RQW86561.1 hypothetical protein DKL51_27380 [Micromonospora globispora]